MLPPPSCGSGCSATENCHSTGGRRFTAAHVFAVIRQPLRLGPFVDGLLGVVSSTQLTHFQGVFGALLSSNLGSRSFLLFCLTWLANLGIQEHLLSNVPITHLVLTCMDSVLWKAEVLEGHGLGTRLLRTCFVLMRC